MTHGSLVQDVDKQVEPHGSQDDGSRRPTSTSSQRASDSKVEPLATSITKTSDEASVTLKKAQATMGTIDELAGEDSIVSYRLGKTLEELSSAARSLRLLADTLQHQPDAVIFGKKNTGGK